VRVIRSGGADFGCLGVRGVVLPEPGMGGEVVGEIGVESESMPMPTTLSGSNPGTSPAAATVALTAA